MCQWKIKEVHKLSERVSVLDAARELGCGPQAVREHMKRGIWDLGEVIPPEKLGKKTWGYYIYRSKLDRILGKELKSETSPSARRAEGITY